MRDWWQPLRTGHVSWLHEGSSRMEVARGEHCNSCSTDDRRFRSGVAIGARSDAKSWRRVANSWPACGQGNRPRGLVFFCVRGKNQPAGSVSPLWIGEDASRWAGRENRTARDSTRAGQVRSPRARGCRDPESTKPATRQHEAQQLGANRAHRGVVCARSNPRQANASRRRASSAAATFTPRAVSAATPRGARIVPRASARCCSPPSHRRHPFVK